MITIRGDVRHASRVPSLIVGVGLTALLAIGLGHAQGAPGRIPTDPNLKVAFIGVIPDDPDLDDQMYSVTYRGLKLVFIGETGAGAGDSIYARYIQDQLATDDHIWRICSWHKNQRAMQVGAKDDEMGWKVYE